MLKLEYKFRIYSNHMATIKQKLAFIKIMENHGNISKSMREVGYSTKSAKNPINLTGAKGFKELVENYIPNEKLAIAHKRLLEDGNFRTQSKAIELLYKVKGLYQPEEKTKNEFSDLSDEELTNLVKRSLFIE